MATQGYDDTDVVDVTVTENAGTYTITVANMSIMRGAMTTPLGSVFWATHDDTWSLLADAGTETNQAGAAGPDQPPLQAGPNTGEPEGDGTVRLASQNPVWTAPNATNLIEVTITPMP